MKIAVGRSTKMMCSGILLSLCWFVFEACDCDSTKEENFPGFWITCVANKPTLMTYNDNDPTVVTSDAAGGFDPSQWDCSTPNSPPNAKPGAPVFKTGSPAGPGGFKRAAHDATGSGLAYLPQRLRELPFMPPLPPSAAATACDSTFPDVLRAIHTDALVTRISTCPFAITATIPVPTRPLQVAITPDGSTALVTSFDNAISFINLATNQVSYTLTTDPSINPDGVAISSDGARAYVTSFNPSNPVVIVIDLASKKIIATIPTITYPQGATLSPDDSQLWITSPLASSIDIIDTLTNTEVSARAVGLTTGVAFNSTGTRAYITSGPNQVVVMDTATFRVLNSYTVGSAPTDIVMSYGDAFLVVNNWGDGSVSVIDLIQNVVKTTKVGANPSGIAWAY